MQMTCVAYRGNTDVDVQFEDGTLAEHKAWDAFLKGYIRHPYAATSRVNTSDKIGVESTAANGMQMTCVAYRGCMDVVV